MRQAKFRGGEMVRSGREMLRVCRSGHMIDDRGRTYYKCMNGSKSVFKRSDKLAFA